MPKKPPEDIMVGVLGTGEMDVDTATTLLEDYMNAEIRGEESVRLIFPLVKGEFSETMDELVTMCSENDLRYEVITNAEDKTGRRFNEIANGHKTYMVPDALTQMENMLVEAPRAVLFVLWDSERDEEMQAMVGKFVDAGIDTRELTDGLTRLGLEEEGGDGEAPEAIEAQSTEVVPEQVMSDGAQGTPEEGLIYSRTDLKEMSMTDLKEVAKALGLPPRKARETMITEILEAQGGEEPEEAPESPVEPQGAPETDHPTLVTTEDLEGFQHRFLDEFQEMVMSLGNTFLSRLSDLVDDKLTDLGKTMEGVAFNLAPEQPMREPEPEPEQPQPRRLVRRR